MILRSLLLYWHLGAAVLLVGASTLQAHDALLALRGRAGRVPASTLASVTAAACSAVFCLGLVAYPAYRVDVRARYLDHVAPWAVNWFDIKENLAALAVPVALALLALARSSASELRGRLAPYYFAGACSIALVTWTTAAVGVVITAMRSI